MSDGICPKCNGPLERRADRNLKTTVWVCRGTCGTWWSPFDLNLARQALKLAP